MAAWTAGADAEAVVGSGTVPVVTAGALQPTSTIATARPGIRRRAMSIRPFWHPLEYATCVELLRNIVVFGHLIGFAVTFGAWVSEAAAQRLRFTAVMNYGLALSFLTGLALAAPWPAGVELNYPKIVTKLVILVFIGAFIGMGSARQRRTAEAAPRWMFMVVGALLLLAAGIGVFW